MEDEETVGKEEYGESASITEEGKGNGSAEESAGATSVQEGEAVVGYGEGIDPERVIVLRNGALYNRDTGRIFKGPTVPPINSENSRQMTERRREKAAEAAMRGMRKAIEGGTAYDTWEKVVEIQTRKALDEYNGRVGIDAARFVGNASGFIGRQGEEEVEGVEVKIGRDALRVMMDRLGYDVIDSEIVEDE